MSDAPILYAQYLDKPLKEHNLLQTITRTDRVYPPNKTHGLIVDYLGIFDDVAKAFKFDERSVEQVISNIAVLRNQLIMCTALHDLSLVEDEDQVSIHDTLNTMRDDERRAIVHQPIQRRANRSFRLRIHR